MRLIYPILLLAFSALYVAQDYENQRTINRLTKENKEWDAEFQKLNEAFKSLSQTFNKEHANAEICLAGWNKTTAALERQTKEMNSFVASVEGHIKRESQ
jgi:hypothetical protein